MKNTINQNQSLSPASFFVGGTPPFLSFDLEYHSLSYFIESNQEKDPYGVNSLKKVAFIGIVAGFEAFCKHQFAAIINIMPMLLNQFLAHRNSVNFSMSTLLLLRDGFQDKIGTILSEQFDFSSPKSINGLYKDLLNVSVFSQKDIRSLNLVLHDRNMLVHHGGFYTLKSLHSFSRNRKVKNDDFVEKVKVNEKRFLDISELLFQLSMKITRVTVNTIKKSAEYTLLKSEGNKMKLIAIDILLQALFDYLDEVEYL